MVKSDQGICCVPRYWSNAEFAGRDGPDPTAWMYSRHWPCLNANIYETHHLKSGEDGDGLGDAYMDGSQHTHQSCLISFFGACQYIFCCYVTRKKTFLWLVETALINLHVNLQLNKTGLSWLILRQKPEQTSFQRLIFLTDFLYQTSIQLKIDMSDKINLNLLSKWNIHASGSNVSQS